MFWKATKLSNVCGGFGCVGFFKLFKCFFFCSVVHLMMDLHYSPEMVITSLESIIAFDSQSKSWLCALFWHLNFSCHFVAQFLSTVSFL